MIPLSPAEIDRFILDSAREANILPLTSGCDCRCIFCSHKNNPPDIVTVSVGVRSMNDITRTLAFLDPRRVITIGESATAIIEGEPFSHPRFREILMLVRRAFPDTPLEITTNGRSLLGEVIGFLEEVGNLFLDVSLNSVSARGRELLMGEGREDAERTIAGMDLLAASTIPFGGSLVAMPNIVGWDDVRGTVVFLAERGAASVRVVTPAFSARADPSIVPDPDRIYKELREFVHGLSADLPCPVLIEPSCVSDLTPVVTGVLRNSPACNAGIRRDDVFVAVNGRRPRCRVEAWNMLLPPGEVVAAVRRGEGVSTVRWVNRYEGDSGITMEYDFDPLRLERVREAVLACPGRSLLLTSELGHAVVGRVLELVDIPRDRAEAALVKNRTFGGTIRAAGLLTVEDYLRGYNAWRAGRGAQGSRAGGRAGPDATPAQMIVPVESFDSRGFDLKRVHVSELERSTGVPVVLR